jgi:hypothetical protein
MTTTRSPDEGIKEASRYLRGTEAHWLGRGQRDSFGIKFKRNRQASKQEYRRTSMTRSAGKRA